MSFLCSVFSRKKPLPPQRTQRRRRLLPPRRPPCPRPPHPRWRRQDLRPGFDALGNDVAAQRSAVAGDWQGEAGTACSSRARTLVDATDAGMTTTGQVATLVGDLAEAFQDLAAF